MSRIRIISDLHWGHKASLVRDADTLRPISEGADLLVFNGDSVEEKYGKSPKHINSPLPTGDQLRAIAAGWGIPTLFITGNHDPLISEHHVLELADILITHGDGSFSSITPWSQQAQDLEDHLKRIIDDPPPKSLHDYLGKIKKAAMETQLDSSRYDPTVWGRLQILFRAACPPTRVLKIISCWKKMPQVTVNRLKEFGCSPRIAIIGHTHKQGMTSYAGTLVINTGSFFQWPGALAVDITEKSLEVISIRKRRDSFSLNKRITEIPHPDGFNSSAISRAIKACTEMQRAYGHSNESLASKQKIGA